MAARGWVAVGLRGFSGVATLPPFLANAGGYNPTANTVVSNPTSMSGFCFPSVNDTTWRAT